MCLKLLSLKCQIVARTKRLRAHALKVKRVAIAECWGHRCIFTRDIKCSKVRNFAPFLIKNCPKGNENTTKHIKHINSHVMYTIYEVKNCTAKLQYIQTNTNIDTKYKEQNAKHTIRNYEYREQNTKPSPCG